MARLTGWNVRSSSNARGPLTESEVRFYRISFGGCGRQRCIQQLVSLSETRAGRLLLAKQLKAVRPESAREEANLKGKGMVMSEGDLIKTGIEGLDSILLGGIPRTNVILVQGVTGSGKTLMGLEFIYRGITEYNEPGLIVVFETSPDKLIRDAAGFGWNLDELQQQKKLQIIFTSPQVLDQELRSPDSLLLETASEMGAQRIFIDGIGLLSRDSSGEQLQRAAGTANCYSN